MSETPRDADVLLVEDNPGDVRLIREAFRDDGVGHTLHVVTDGVEALDYVFRRNAFVNEPRPDLIILDLNIPRKDGAAILEELQTDEDLRVIPVVVLTSSRSDADVERAYRLGANGYLTKPVDPEEFIELIRSLVRYWLSTVSLPDRE